jgi:hypothetical protein
VTGTRWRIAALSLVFIASATTVRAVETAAGEYDVKAAYLYNFGKFVRWPVNEARHENTFEICVAGEDPFRGALDAVLKDAVIGSRKVQQRHVTASADIPGCHILFFSESLQAQAEALLVSLQGDDVLTVSDIPQFVNRGGMIQFVRRGGRVRFEVNLLAAQDAGLTLSADLLRVASAVRKHR